MFSVHRAPVFEIHGDTHEVRVGDNRIKLTPKEIGVLQMLNDRQGTTVSRTELLMQVWGDKLANDQGLTQAVSRLRQVLAPCKSVVIRTIPRRGYQLVHEEVHGKVPSGVWIKRHLTLAIVLLLALVIGFIIFLQPVRIRVRKQITLPEKGTTSTMFIQEHGPIIC